MLLLPYRIINHVPHWLDSYIHPTPPSSSTLASSLLVITAICCCNCFSFFVSFLFVLFFFFDAPLISNPVFVFLFFCSFSTPSSSLTLASSLLAITAIFLAIYCDTKGHKLKTKFHHISSLVVYHHAVCFPFYVSQWMIRLLVYHRILWYHVAFSVSQYFVVSQWLLVYHHSCLFS